MLTIHKPLYRSELSPVNNRQRLGAYRSEIAQHYTRAVEIADMCRGQKLGSKIHRIQRQNRMSRYKIYRIPQQNHFIRIQYLQDLTNKQKIRIQDLQDPTAKAKNKDPESPETHDETKL